MAKFLANGKTVDEFRDGKTPKQRSAAAKKAAETRKKNRGGKVKVTIEIDGKLNSGLDKVVKIDGATSRESAIETAIRQYLMQNRVLD